MESKFVHSKLHNPVQDFFEILYGCEAARLRIDEDHGVFPMVGVMDFSTTPPGVVVDNGAGKSLLLFWRLVKAIQNRPAFYTNMLGEKCMLSIHSHEIIVTTRLTKPRRKSTHHPVYSNRQISAMMR
jgi:hypothetical protein